MAYQMFDFNAKYRFGIDEMDRDHKQLVDMLNHVSHVLDQGKIKEAAEHFNQMLSVYVAEHFANKAGAKLHDSVDPHSAELFAKACKGLDIDDAKLEQIEKAAVAALEDVLG